MSAKRITSPVIPGRGVKMKNVFIGSVVFSASEGTCSPVASGWSHSQERLSRWLRGQARGYRHYLNGDLYLAVDQVQPVTAAVVSEII